MHAIERTGQRPSRLSVLMNPILPGAIHKDPPAK